MEPKKARIVWQEVIKAEVEKLKEYKISYKMNPEDIMTFVSGLHEVQADMIECAVIKKEKEGFPEATAVIKHIMEKK